MCKYWFKPGFHTCVSRTHNNARCLKMYGHQRSQAITAFATKACELATKSHVLNFCEGLCRDMLWLWYIETKNARKEDFLSSEKKSKAKYTKKITTTSGKSLFLSDKMQETKKFFRPPKKKSKAKYTKKMTTTFGTSLFLIKCKKQKRFCPPKKKEQSQIQKKMTTTFRHFWLNTGCNTQSPNTKDLAINHMMVAYGNRQNATAFANNSILLRSLKHLMETRLYVQIFVERWYLTTYHKLTCASVPSLH